MLVKHPEFLKGFTEPDTFGGELLFFKHGETIFSLAMRPEQKLIWVMGALGHGVEWLRALKKWGLREGYEWVGFKTKRENKAVQALAKYWKGRLMAVTDSGDEYCVPLMGR